MKILHNIYIAVIVFLLCLFLFGWSIFRYEMSAPSDDSEKRVVEIKPGGVESIAETLYERGIIRNKLAFLLYVKFTNYHNLKAATYQLAPNMDVSEVVKILFEGRGSNSDEITITFKEGWNVRKIAKTIAEYTTHSEEEIYDTLKNEEYLKRMIGKYWFLTDDILNRDIYYSLEGYLYPNTYNFSSSSESIEKIFDIMLADTEKKLSEKKEEILSSQFSIHEIFTLASIVELEGNTLEDKRGIVSVFQNRLSQGMNLGSDVTTYYGAKVDMGERDLYSSEISACNSYNTRCATYKKLPISPICNPTLDSIEAVLNPDNSSYLYFVADKNKKIYFSKTLREHEKMIQELKQKNLWLEY